MTNHELIVVLNNLIQTCKDCEAGFRICAQSQSESYFGISLMEHSKNCGDAALELENLVVEHGGNPERSGSLSGALHRRWIGIKAAIMGKDDEAILDECERGEIIARHNYRQALSQELPELERKVIERQYQEVYRNYEMVKMMREQMHTH